VFAVGEKAVKIAEGTAENGGTVFHFATKEEALGALREQFTAGAAMLVKASHAMHFEWLVEQLSR
jgi:UDP-N-acetylmuramoyl-tripeptide--D-alanyl-D-alanine ligase